MSKKSAGILLYRFHNKLPEVLLVHPGGPFWKKKDEGAWSIPKGEFAQNEDPLDAAKREVKEELGINVQGEFIELAPVKQKGGKTVYTWSVRGSFDPAELKSNTFEIEWPPKSGRKITFPEIDKAGWFTINEAKKKIMSGQIPLLDEFENKILLIQHESDR